MDDQDKDQVINTWYNGEALTYTYWGSTGEYRRGSGMREHGDRARGRRRVRDQDEGVLQGSYIYF